MVSLRLHRLKPMKTALDITALDLREWAKSIDCPPNLPRLIRRLINESVDGLTKCHFPSDEEIYLPEYDGYVESVTATQYVPHGSSVWELSSNSRPSTKAQRDLSKRSEKPIDVEPSTTTFVFAAPTRFTGKKAWIERAKKEGPWADVRVWDASDLASWLEQCPSTHAWLAARLGKRKAGCQNLDDFFDEWAGSSLPCLTPAVVIGGRGENRETVMKWLNGPPSALCVRSETSREAIAFLYASMMFEGEERKHALVAKSLVIDALDTWREMAHATRPLILVANLAERDRVHAAVAQGHHVLIPLNLSDASTDDALVLHRADVEALKGVLFEAGVEEGRVAELARLGRRSFAALRRALSSSPSVMAPSWSSQPTARLFSRLMLVGSWLHASEADKNVVAQITDTPYKEVLEALEYWKNQPDAPMQLLNGAWLWTSREDAWVWLSPHITGDDLSRYCDVTTEILGRDDPRYELPAEERYAASIHGKVLPESELVRKGLSETLALLAANNDDLRLANGQSGQGWADGIVRSLLDAQPSRRWASLSGLLPVLAEASPTSFLNAVSNDISTTNSVVIDLFEDREQSSFVGSSHTGLLWALETLCWPLDYLNRATRALGTLARIEPGGRQANRPANSLRDVFLYWHPSTVASAEQRLKALDHLRIYEPEIAWRLMLSLLPGQHSFTMSTHRPRFRDWGSGYPKPQLQRDVSAYLRGILDRCLEDVTKSTGRWLDFIDQLAAVDDDHFNVFMALMERADIENLTSDQRVAVWHALRRLVSRHMEFPDSSWAMPKARCDAILTALERFTPASTLERHITLFSHRPEALIWNRLDHDAFEAQLSKLRESAVAEIFATGGISALFQLGQSVDVPAEIGSLAGTTLSLEEADEHTLIVRGLASENRGDRSIAIGFLHGRGANGPDSWAHNLTSSEWFTALPSEIQAEFCVALPFEKATWDLVDGLDSEAQAHYWSRAFGWLPNASKVEDYAHATEKLLEASRPVEALHILKGHSRNPIRVSAKLALTVLEKLFDIDATKVNWSMIDDMVVETISELAEHPEIESEQLIVLEWNFLPLFTRRDMAPPTLGNTLASDPKAFIELLSTVFKERSKPPKEDYTPEEQGRARLAYELLEAWNTPPGTHDGAMDRAELFAWVREARKLAAECDRSAITDHYIAHVLRHCPSGTDGIWPHEAVRELFEEVQSEKLESGLANAFFNARGVTTRMPAEGGSQERSLASMYGERYAHLQDWPRIASVFKSLEQTYLEHAAREDEEAEYEKRYTI